jgi:hypothetical protein
MTTETETVKVCRALTELQQTILDHLRRSNEPVSDLEYQHRLTYDDPELSKGDVTRAINQLLELKLIRVASTLVIDREKIRMLSLPEPPEPQIKGDPKSKPVRTAVARRPLSAETRRKIGEALRGRERGPLPQEMKRKLSEVFRGRKFSDETRRRISEAQRRRYAARKAVGVTPACR